MLKLTVVSCRFCWLITVGWPAQPFEFPITLTSSAITNHPNKQKNKQTKKPSCKSFTPLPALCCADPKKKKLYIRTGGLLFLMNF